MLSITLDREEAIVTLEPSGVLTEDDFKTAVKVIDPFIKQHGKLTGLIIETKDFPGWKDFAAFTAHLKFIRNHHKKVKKLAFVTDSSIGDFAEKIGSHFVEAEVKTFPYGAHKEAREWILR
ncbi:MAG: STAS/SEC14 domain-containing protein [Sulfurovum sp.]|nr:STAS/SEC14 domain-containing protein [Sulfurovum sp.]